MRSLGAFVIAGLLSVSVSTAVRADKTKGTVENAAKTGGDAVVDGSRAVGRTTRAFFKGGASAAKSTWKGNARKTGQDAKANGRATRAAAKGH
jgi:hypothetical protein